MSDNNPTVCMISSRSIESPWKSRRTEFSECKGQIMSSNSSPTAAVQLCYEHLNGSCVKTPYSPASRVILYMVYGFGAVLAVFGNLLVMTAILHFKQLHMTIAVWDIWSRDEKFWSFKKYLEFLAFV